MHNADFLLWQIHGHMAPLAGSTILNEWVIGVTCRQVNPGGPISFLWETQDRSVYRDEKEEYRAFISRNHLHIYIATSIMDTPRAPDIILWSRNHLYRPSVSIAARPSRSAPTSATDISSILLIIRPERASSATRLETYEPRPPYA